MMEKYAEDDRIEQMNAQKRRMKQLEHKRAVENLIQQRRSMFQGTVKNLAFIQLENYIVSIKVVI